MALTTDQITFALRTCPYTSPQFIGVFASNLLPSSPPRPSGCVINLDESHLPGSHWVSCYVDQNGRADYYDSYGRAPTNEHIQKWLSDNAVKVVSNDTVVQAPYSVTCGSHCIWFLVHRCRGLSSYRIARMYSDPWAFDRNVSLFVRKHFGLPNRNLHKTACHNQFCRPFNSLK